MGLTGFGACNAVIGDPVGSHVGVVDGTYEADAGVFFGESGWENEADGEESAIPFGHWTAEVDLRVLASIDMKLDWRKWSNR